MIRKTILATLFMAFFFVSYAQNKQEKPVTDAVARLTRAMIDADRSTLEALAAEQLTYGHSSGKVEDKTAFVQSIVSGASDFVTLDLTHQTISFSGDVALVRHQFDAKTNDGGKPGEAHLFVLQVWQKQHGQWKLIARQAVKQPQNS